MKRTFGKLARASKGLIQDQVGVEGALLEADNVRYERPGEIRARGGKGAQVAITGATGGNAAFYFPEHAAAQGTYDYLLGGKAGSAESFVATPSGAIYLSASDTPANCRAEDPDGVTGVVELAGEATATFAPSPHGVPFDGELWVLGSTWSTGGGQSTGGIRWAGSVESSYTTGTVSGTSGGRTLTGSGTTWTSDMVGMYVRIDAATVGERAFRITRFISTTSVEVDRPFDATFAGDLYRFDMAAWWSMQPGVFGGGILDGLTTPDAATTFAYANARCCGVHQGRVFLGNVVTNDLVHRPDRLAWTNLSAEADGQWGGAERVQANAYIDVQPGVGGVGLRGIASDRSRLYILKERALFALNGYVRSDGQPTGSTIELMMGDDGQFSTSVPPLEIPGGVVFAGRRGVYLVRGGEVRNLCEGRVQALYESMFTQQSSPTAGGLGALSFVGDRIIVHGTATRASAMSAEEPNVLVYDAKLDVWTTQTTWATSRAVGPVELSVGAFGETPAGDLVRWDRDYEEGEPYDDGSSADVLVRLTTHPILLAGDMNARVRAVQLLQRFSSASETVAMSTEVLCGEAGMVDAVVAGDAVSGTSDEEWSNTERWTRLPLRSGTPPVAEARVRLQTDQGCDVLRLYEVGFEWVGVGRVRQ